MFEKYIIIENDKIYLKQNAGGIWYCDKLPCNDIGDMDRKIPMVNSILNKYNNNSDGKKKKTPHIPLKKEKNKNIELNAKM